MPMRENINPGPTPHDAGRFATTHWSVVRAAGRPDSVHYRQALETLCQTYWFPLYAYLRRHGNNANRAEEYTQAFFAHLLEKESVRLADPSRGKFRSFLLASLKHFLSDLHDYEHAKKRGGGKQIFSLDFENAETQYALEPADRLNADKLFDRSWAMTVLDRAMTRLQDEAKDEKKKKLFEELKVYLTAGKDAASYGEVAERIGMSEGTVRVAVHRLRKRYREVLRDEIAQTVSSEEEIDQEIRDLFTALAQ
ncbi:MAG: RNA polymerase sigma factor [Planctomycetota bacterium]|jgi:RNA polymerase sigma-70 factor (ECF subfamily)